MVRTIWHGRRWERNFFKGKFLIWLFRFSNESNLVLLDRWNVLILSQLVSVSHEFAFLSSKASSILFLHNYLHCWFVRPINELLMIGLRKIRNFFRLVIWRLCSYLTLFRKKNSIVFVLCHALKLLIFFYFCLRFLDLCRF